MKISDTFQIVSMEQQIGSVRMKAPFAAESIRAAENLPEKLKTASQWFKNTSKNDNFNFEKTADVLPKDEDYIFVNFRALSKATVPGHWIDWSKDNVLKDSVPKLLGATVYPNHDFTDINNWLGAVQNVAWDEQGANAQNVPGINATYKIDALMNPRIARGLLMNPPAIHSTSMTVLFKFEFSHPDIANESRWRFMELLGEEVEGEIVRFIVTEILEYWEASLVFQGADRLAKQYDDDEEDFDDESLNAANLDMPTNLAKKEKTEMAKCTDCKDAEATLCATCAKKKKMSADPEEANLSVQLEAANQKITDLQEKADVADKYVEEKRAEVTRLAKIAELGAGEGELDEVISAQINEANFERLQGLTKYYEKKAADKFPPGRSSQESSDEVETAGGVKAEQQTTVPQTIGLH